MKDMSNTAVEERLMEMHDKKEILYVHKMTPKWIVLDLEFLILSLNKILQRINDDEQVTFFKEMDLKNIIRSNKDAPLIDIMSHVGILAKAVHSSTNENIFVISACRIAPNQLETLRQLPSQNDSPHVHSSILCLKFNELPLVSCVFQLIICQLLHKFPYDIQGRRCLIYNNVAAFKLSTDATEKKRLFVFTDENRLFIYIIRYNECTGGIEPTLCGEIRQLVENTLIESLNADIDTSLGNSRGKRTNKRVKTAMRKIKFEYMIRCPETKDLKIKEEGLINVHDLKKVADTASTQERKIYHCSNHSDKAHPHELDVQSLLCSWFPEDSTFHNQECDPRQTAVSAAIPSSSTFDMCNQISEVKVTAKIAGKIADCIGQRWQLLAFELDVDQPTLDKIIDNNPRNTEKAITDMLMHCVNKRQGQLTLKEVEEGILTVGVNVNWDKFKSLYLDKASA